VEGSTISEATGWCKVEVFLVTVGATVQQKLLGGKKWRVDCGGEKDGG